MKLAEAYVDITTRTGMFTKGLAKVRAKLTAGMKRMAAIARQWARIIGLALAAAFTAAIWAATKFEEQMANVSTMLTKTTMKAMKGFEEGMKRLAVAFGQSTETLAKGLYDILSAGIAASKGMAVLETASRAAIAGMTDTAAAVDVITTMLNSYQLSASEAGRVSDALFATVKAGKLTFDELARFMGMVAAPAAAAGEKMEELLAGIATLTRAGVRPRIAVTYLRQALMAFSKSTPDAMKAAEKFGFTLETETLRTIGLVGVLKKLEGARAEEIAAIFSSNEAYNAMITLRGDMIGLERDLAAQYKASGSTLAAYNKIAETAAQWFKRLKQLIVVLAADIGKMFLPALKAMSKALLNNQEKIKFFVYNVVAKAWNKLLDIFAIGDTVLHNWSSTWKLAMDTASFAVKQFALDTKHWLGEMMDKVFADQIKKAKTWVERLAAIMILDQRHIDEMRESFGWWQSEAEMGSKAWAKMKARQGKEMGQLMLDYDNLASTKTKITKRELSKEEQAEKKSLAGRWAEFSKDLTKRSKKYEKYKIAILTKDMMGTKIAEETAANIQKQIDLQEKLAEAIRRVSFVGLEQGFKQVQLSALNIVEPVRPKDVPAVERRTTPLLPSEYGKPEKQITIQEKQLKVQEKQLSTSQEIKKIQAETSKSLLSILYGGAATPANALG